MPMLPPAPATFSTKNCCFSDSVSFVAISRAAMSVGPAGANGTMIFTGLLG